MSPPKSKGCYRNCEAANAIKAQIHEADAQIASLGRRRALTDARFQS